MKEILIFVYSLFSLDVFAQISSDSLLRHNFLEAIGNRISLDSNFEPIKHGPIINGYTGKNYLPAKTTPINYAGISFEVVQVFVNKRRKIKFLIYEKNYSSSDSVSVSNNLRDDFNFLANQISVKYDAQFKLIGKHSDPRYLREAAVWQIKKRKIELIKSHGELKNSDGKFYSYLELHFF